MGTLGGDPHTRPMCEQLVQEGLEVCRRAGIDPGASERQEADAIMQCMYDMPLHYPSMCQDMFKGRPTEVDYINGCIVRLGREHGYEAVRHEFLANEVHLAETARAFHESRRA